MIDLKVTTTFNRRKVQDPMRRQVLRGLGHFAAYVRTAARSLIRRRKGPSKAGSPPHTHGGRLKQAVLYFVDRGRQEAIVGPSHRIVGIAGAEQEHGGRYREETFEARPFMAPALERSAPKFPEFVARPFG